MGLDSSAETSAILAEGTRYQFAVVVGTGSVEFGPVEQVRGSQTEHCIAVEVLSSHSLAVAERGERPGLLCYNLHTGQAFVGHLGNPAVVAVDRLKVGVAAKVLNIQMGSRVLLCHFLDHVRDGGASW